MKLGQMLQNSSFTRSNLVKAALMVAVCVPVGMLVPQHLTVSPTPSLGDRFFVISKNVSVSSIKSGDIVRYPHCDAATEGKTLFMLKRVACVPGQRLQVDNKKEYYCDGQYLGRAKDYSKKGNAVRNFVYNGVVPEGKFFAFAGHKDSYDSRYYGFVSMDTVDAKAYPIF